MARSAHDGPLGGAGSGGGGGDEVARIMAYRVALRELENRVQIFLSLPLASLDRLKLQSKLDEIGLTRLSETDLHKVED